MKEINWKCITNSILILLFVIITNANSIGQTSSKSFRSQIDSLISDLNRKKIDTIIAIGIFGYYYEDLLLAYKLNSKYVADIFKKPHSKGHEKEMRSFGKKDIYFQILYNYKEQILGYLNKNIYPIPLDTIKTEFGYIVSHGMTSGPTFFVYIQLGDYNVNKSYCCGIYLNSYFYKYEYELWLLLTAFHNDIILCHPPWP